MSIIPGSEFRDQNIVRTKDKGFTFRSKEKMDNGSRFDILEDMEDNQEERVVGIFITKP